MLRNNNSEGKGSNIHGNAMCKLFWSSAKNTEINPSKTELSSFTLQSLETGSQTQVSFLAEEELL